MFVLGETVMFRKMILQMILLHKHLLEKRVLRVA